jgi:hypothetical protein
MAKPPIESEAALAHARQWADGLDAVAPLVGRRFPRSKPRQQALTYVRGLLSPVERKPCWPWPSPLARRRPTRRSTGWGGRCGAPRRCATTGGRTSLHTWARPLGGWGLTTPAS